MVRMYVYRTVGNFDEPLLLNQLVNEIIIIVCFENEQNSFMFMIRSL